MPDSETTLIRLPLRSLASSLATYGKDVVLTTRVKTAHAIEEHLYLVDPHGNWMMRFPANLELTGAGKAKRDLERLMRASSSWDEPGR